MSKEHIPGSMDLLLDTMCNTFGGIVFIALSLALAFFVSQSQSSPIVNTAKIQQELKEQQEECLILEQKKDSLTQKLSLLKEYASLYSKKDSKLPEIVTGLEQDCRNLQREIDLQKIELKTLRGKCRDLEKDNQTIASQNSAHQTKIIKNKEKLETEYRQLCSIVDGLKGKMRQDPAKKVHFARNERTNCNPYVLVLKDNRLYRLGANYFHSSPEVDVKRERNCLLLTLHNGTPLTSITPAMMPSLFPGYSKSSHFLSIALHPDSFEAFVKFRRMLREGGFRVRWSVHEESPIELKLVEDAKYSSSN